METEWTVSSFTMDWRLTCAELPVVFEADEPICMILPQRRGELEGFHPEIRELDEEPQTASAYRQWADKRGKFNQDLKVPGSEAVKRSWQRDYVLGTVPGGFRAEEHQTKPGPLTRLLSSHEQPPAFAGRTFRTDAHSQLYLISGYLLCRHCHDLSYETRQVGRKHSALRKCQKIRRRLGGNANMTEPFPPRLKGMHLKDYRRLRLEHDEADRQYTELTLADLKRMKLRLSRIGGEEG